MLLKGHALKNVNNPTYRDQRANQSGEVVKSVRIVLFGICLICIFMKKTSLFVRRREK